MAKNKQIIQLPLKDVGMKTSDMDTVLREGYIADHAKTGTAIAQWIKILAYQPTRRSG